MKVGEQERREEKTGRERGRERCDYGWIYSKEE